MNKKKVGLISMGSYRNRPFWEDLIARIEPEAAVEMRGVLDGLTKEEIEAQYAFSDGENYIVTEMFFGGTVHISEEKARVRVAQIADAFFKEGAAAVLVLCTGDFNRPGSKEWAEAVAAHGSSEKAEDGSAEAEAGAYSGIFLLPEDLLYGLIQGLRQDRIGFIVPEEAQIRESEEHYADLHPIVKAASPYGEMETLRETAASFREEPVQVIVTDCMGFTAEMGRMVAEESGKQVLVPRLLLPKIVKALVTQL